LVPTTSIKPAGTVYTVPVKQSNGILEFGAAQAAASKALSNTVSSYDFSPDGKRTLLDQVSQQTGQSVTVMTNFTAGLKSK
jgi:hypothetical protein